VINLDKLFWAINNQRYSAYARKIYQDTHAVIVEILSDVRVESL